MARFHIPPLRILAGLAMALALSSAAYSFAASNGLQDTSGNATGYSAANIHYTLNAANPTSIDSVSFDIVLLASGTTPRTVKAKLVNSSNTWFSCAPAAGKSWNCAVIGVTIAQADQLSVVAAN